MILPLPLHASVARHGLQFVNCFYYFQGFAQLAPKAHAIQVPCFALS